MNERIRELARQAGYNIKELDAQEQMVAEKFAELIVRECLNQCEQVATDADTMTKSKFVTDTGRVLHEGMWGGAMNCKTLIKHNFGVEE